MSKILDILMDYTSGAKDVDTTNAALKEANAGFHLEPGKNVLTEEEIRASVVGHYPEMANGFGLLILAPALWIRLSSRMVSWLTAIWAIPRLWLSLLIVGITSMARSWLSRSLSMRPLALSCPRSWT